MTFGFAFSSFAFAIAVAISFSSFSSLSVSFHVGVFSGSSNYLSLFCISFISVFLSGWAVCCLGLLHEIMFSYALLFCFCLKGFRNCMFVKCVVVAVFLVFLFLFLLFC